MKRSIAVVAMLVVGSCEQQEQQRENDHFLPLLYLLGRELFFLFLRRRLILFLCRIHN